ncbi:MAG TPA: hypothetical protein VGE74_04080, partial [Gemmata sp.]
AGAAPATTAPAPSAEPPLPAPAGPNDLPHIAAALKRVLGRTRPVRINVIHRELSKELGHTFDPTAFGCNSTGAFVRRFAGPLGVVVRGAQNEQEIDLLGVPAPSTNGSHATKNPAGRTAVPCSALAEPHTAAHYKELLGKGRANENTVSVIPWDALVAVCEVTVLVLAPPTGGPAQSLELLPKLKAAGAPDGARLIVSALRCALPQPTDKGLYALPAGATGAQIRARLLSYIVYVLRTRLHDTGVGGPINAAALAEVLEPGPALEQVHQEVANALAEPAPEPAGAPVPTPARTSARVEAVHTPAGYRDLLKSGGQEGSAEPEHQSINPPPWTSFERICADTFAALAPEVGRGELTLDQFHDHLYAAEKDVPVPNYRSHARRAVTILKLSNAVLESDGRVTLHPQVAEPNDIRWAVLGVMLTVLSLRLRERAVPGPVRPDVFAAAIAAGPLTDELVPQIAQAIESMERAFPEAEAPPEATATAPEEKPPGDPESAPDEVQIGVLAELANEPALATGPEPDGPQIVVPEVVAVEVAVPGSAPEPATAGAATEWPDAYAFDGALPGGTEQSAPEPVQNGDTRAMEPLPSGAPGLIEHIGAVPAPESACAAPTDADGPAPPAPAVETVPHPEALAFATPDEAFPRAGVVPEPAPGGADGAAVRAPAQDAPAAHPGEDAAPSGSATDEPTNASEPAPPVTATGPEFRPLNQWPPHAGDPAVPAELANDVAPPSLPPEGPLSLDDEYPLAIPIADWLPDDDPYFESPPAPPASAGGGFGVRIVSPPPAPADTFSDVATITPSAPPPEFRQPPPFPPLPPESA